MNDQSWQLVEHVFNVAIEMPAAERGAYLDSACLNPTIRAEVESLIAAEEKSKTFFENQIATAARDAAGEREEAQKKRVHYLGPYRIVQTLSAGAQLFLAERSDGARVAVQVLRTESDEGRARAAWGRRRLERLEHPNITRILEGGLTPKGAPYVVAELPEEETLVAWCDREQAPLERRIELFRAVCGAVHFGHQRLVLHGALETENVRITQEGTPKLADFGLAGLHEAAEEPGTHRLRRSPDYASPEEIRGEPPTISSEVYSLGVLLYELLSGRKPYDLRESSRVEIERIVGEIEPCPPSEAVGGEGEGGPSRAREASRAALRRQLQGKLDGIVMRAMHKEPQRRYASAQQLADDLEAFLPPRPVRAPSDPTALRAPRWAAAAGVAALLALSATAAFWGWARYEQAAARIEGARQAQREAESVSNFLSELFGVADPREDRASAVTAVEALDWGAERIAREMPDRPLEHARLMNALSEAYLQLGLHARALELAGQALSRAEAAVGKQHPGTAASLGQLGRVQLASGRAADAASSYRAAVSAQRAAQPASPLDLASALAGLADSLAEAGDAAQAEAPAREALELRQTALADGGPEVASSLHTLGAIERRMGRLADAEGHLRQALQARRAHRGELHLETAATLEELGATLHEAGRLEEAEEALGKALSATLEIRGERHPAAADSLRALAGVLRERGRRNEAREMLQVALDVDRAALGSDRLEVASDLEALGALALEQGDPSDAEQRLRAALEIRWSRLGAGAPSTAPALLSLAETLMQLTRAAEAEQAFQEALHLLRDANPPDRPAMARAETGLAQCLASQGRYPDAERLLLTGPAAQSAPAAERRAALAVLEQVYEGWGRGEDAARVAKELSALE